MSTDTTRATSGERMPEGRTWAVQGVPLTDIAERFGTPVCVYDADELGRQWRVWQTAHPEPLESAYLLAANPNVAITATTRAWCAGAVVGTHTELTSALLSGYPADTIVLDAPLGSPGLLRAALGAGIGVFSVPDVEQAGLLDDASVAGEPTDVVARIDPAQPARARDVLDQLLAHPFEQLRVTGVCLPPGAVTADTVGLVAQLLDRLGDVPARHRLVVLQPDNSDGLESATGLTAEARVVVASGHPQVGAASTLLVRVIQAGRPGAVTATMDCPLPPDAEIHSLTTAPGTADADRAGVCRIGDLFAAPGISLLDLPLPVGHVLSHGVPAEVLVVDGRAVSIRSAATTEYLLSRQSVISPTD